ncbi:MAG: PTS transporter subunit EIIC [Lachnospiraceae bacterium]|nr:PTS transporter subunit EIIC [Lachnospiraceae bacterium]
MGKKNKIMDFFSALGRSLLMPVAALAACGIVLGLSSALMKAQVVAAVPILNQTFVHFIIYTLNKVSGVVFSQIPVLFAISISFGLATDEKEIAAFAGFIGYYTFLVASKCMIDAGFMDFSALKISSILGVETMDMGAVAGIITGLVTAKLHNKYHKVQFPVAISFYGGKRFVALVVMMAMAVVGLIAPLVWEPVSVVINGAGSLISSTGLAGVFVYGFLERLLIPTGLHHVLNGIFRTTAIGGVYQGVEGCLNIFLQFIDKVDIHELAPFTVFLGQGKMPMMMFGLSGAALAIYQTAPAEKKGKVKALMIAGVAASVVSGITEPMEFSFMFVAPPLFLFHAVMGGLSFMLMAAFKVIIGNTGGGLIDYFIWGVFQPGSNWYWVLIVGPFFFVIYYFVFKTYLTKKNLSIDVSDDEEESGSSKTSSGSMDEKNREKAARIIEGLGGFENIGVVNNCLTRLRVDIKDMSLVNEELLKKTGAMGFVRSSDTHIQVIYGPKVERIASDVREIMKY